MNGCNGNCNQGRNCTCLKNSNLFWDVIKQLVALSVLVDIIVSLCFLIGYFWYLT
jgi:hypothetical protein